MTKNLNNHLRVLAIVPSTKGFGFVVLEGGRFLVDWGFKWVEDNKNNECLEKIGQMIARYDPDLLVLEDYSPKRCSLRIRWLNKRISKLCEEHKLKVAAFSSAQMKQVFFPDGKGTKYSLAEFVSQQFPDELDFQLPPERKNGDSENPRINVFTAVALALMVRS